MVIGVGFVLAGVFARLWARRAGEPLGLERRLLPGERLEGGEVRILISLGRHQRFLGGSIELRQQLGEIEKQCRVHGHRVEIAFSGLPRGRHRLGPLRATLSDPLGLERLEQEVDDELVVLIRPRIPLLRSVFSTQGARETGVARSTFRTASGFEIHAIRDHVPGEPLRAVHWPSTARRGRLMVKELDDAPRDELVVVIDQDPDGVAGPLGASSFDAAVRATGALALAHASWNRRVVIVGSSASFGAVPVSSGGHDWDLALDALAGVVPVAGSRVSGPLRSTSGPLGHAREIIVVTGRPAVAVGPMIELKGRGRRVSLVVVASETFAGRDPGRAHPEVLRAAAQGIPVSVISAGMTIEDSLSGGLARSLSA